MDRNEYSLGVFDKSQRMGRYCYRLRQAPEPSCVDEEPRIARENGRRRHVQAFHGQGGTSQHFTV
jgi:hypothetical protein